MEDGKDLLLQTGITQSSESLPIFNSLLERKTLIKTVQIHLIIEGGRSVAWSRAF